MFQYLPLHKPDWRSAPIPAKWPMIVIIVFLMCPYTQAKDHLLQKIKTSNLLLEGRINYGFLINHHLEMEIYNAHFMAFEINLGTETYGKSRWQAMYAYPVIGVSYWYSDMGNSEYLGNAHALFPYINFPLIGSEKYALNFRAGGGLGYLTKHFDRLNNYKYLAIGSNLNAAINIMFELRWKPSTRMEVSAGIALMHFSNGSLKTPNFGINIPTANLAIACRLTRKNEYTKMENLPEINKFEFNGHKNTEFDISGTIGMKEIPEYSKRFYVYNLSGNVFKTISYKSKLGAGFDLNYDNSDLFIVELKQLGLRHKCQIIKPGANLGYQLNLSRTSFVFNMGMYIGGKVKSQTSSYFKLSTRVMLSKSVFASLLLKSHFARVDFIGFGLGYKIKFL
jgi:hypothetical protein